MTHSRRHTKNLIAISFGICALAITYSFRSAAAPGNKMFSLLFSLSDLKSSDLDYMASGKPDLAVSLRDVQRQEGLLRVRVRNVGTEPSARTTVALQENGRTLALAPLPVLQAPTGFSDVLLPIPFSANLDECSVVADPDGMLNENTVMNNRINLKELALMTNTNFQTASNDSVSGRQQLRPEHLAFNVKDPQAIAKWYVDHLGMKIYRSGAPPGNTRFVGDSAGNMMLELGTNTTVPYTDYASWNQISMHVAFMVDDIKAMRDSLLAVGAKVADDITKTPSGDQVLMMRDPWGLSIQFVSRVNPMLKSTGLRFEHFALNVNDPQKMVNWYVENMGMKLMRQGGPPTYGSFVSDAGGHMMLELQFDTRYPVMDLSKIEHPAMHFAFVVDDVRSVRTRLIAAGATIAEELRETNAGDQVLVLRDPWGFAIQFIKRGEAMLK